MVFNKKTAARIEEIIESFSGYLKRSKCFGVLHIKQAGFYTAFLNPVDDYVDQNETIKSPEHLCEAIMVAICCETLENYYHGKELPLGTLEKMIGEIRADFALCVHKFPEYQKIADDVLAKTKIMDFDEITDEDEEDREDD